jgi:4-hydroxy-tetrahydrodipicolinate reductase
VGTTGWYDHLEDVKAEVAAGNGKLFYATNFSVGVNIFQAVNRYLAKIMNGFADYDVTMEETHHIHKLDSPSGTAITLANTILGELDRKNAWMETAQVPEGKTLADVEARSPKDDELAITAYRRGEVPGIHTVVWDSAVDTITLTHSAKSRAGFALGAVLAAEFLPGQKAGVYNMSDLMPF